MTTCTPIYQLPIVEGTDRPCDISDTSCAFAEAVEAQLDLLDAAVARTQGTTPFSMISIAGDIAVPSTTLIYTVQFDTTLVDTNNMVDLASDNTSIYIRTAGVYTFFVSLELTLSPGATSLQSTQLITSAAGSPVSGNTDYFIQNYTASSSMPVKNTGGRLDNSCYTGEYICNCSVGDHYSLVVTVAGGTTTTIHEVRIGALWLRDPL